MSIPSTPVRLPKTRPWVQFDCFVRTTSSRSTPSASRNVPDGNLSACPPSVARPHNIAFVVEKAVSSSSRRGGTAAGLARPLAELRLGHPGVVRDEPREAAHIVDPGVPKSSTSGWSTLIRLRIFCSPHLDPEAGLLGTLAHERPQGRLADQRLQFGEHLGEHHDPFSLHDAARRADSPMGAATP